VNDATPITYWSTDVAGNKEAPNTLTPQSDTTAPVTTASTDPTGWTNGKVDVTLTAADAGGSGLDTTWYQIGNGPATPYSGPITATDATPITYWSTDKAGNKEAPNTLTPQIDTTAPPPRRHRRRLADQRPDRERDHRRHRRLRRGPARLHRGRHRPGPARRGRLVPGDRRR